MLLLLLLLLLVLMLLCVSTRSGFNCCCKSEQPFNGLLTPRAPDGQRLGGTTAAGVLPARRPHPTTPIIIRL
ncbi:hypothetical protein EYF80_035730 [Liparis tanakae]|uniref:Secreted peptide n=1 Tax=Liparis tanakae TaxID=230148 RepID=A0A4Z2GL35_9TELE|nr:hypothetical protein EYF80_035730 [Liparis tanakae]